jgi:hypothetical protein
MRSKWESHVQPRLEEIEAWARDGVSEKDIAQNLGIAYSTFREYRDKYSALGAALARTKEYVDKVVVVGAYLRRITGYDTTEVRREYAWTLDDEGNPKRILAKEIEQTRHIPGDPRAAEFWLTRRQGKDWPMQLAAKQEESEEGGIVEIPAVAADG